MPGQSVVGDMLVFLGRMSSSEVVRKILATQKWTTVLLDINSKTTQDGENKSVFVKCNKILNLAIKITFFQKFVILSSRQTSVRSDKNQTNVPLHCGLAVDLFTITVRYFDRCSCCV